MRQKLSAIFLAVVLSTLPSHVLAASLSAQELKSIMPGLSPAEAKQLAETGKVTRFVDANSSPSLVPQCSLQSSVDRTFASVPHTIGVEALFVMDPGNGSSKEHMLRWYNVLRSISTMKGIKYYSNLYGRVRVMFRDSYVINNPVAQKRLPDPLVSAIPSESELTIKQDDATFGWAIFHLRYRSAADALSVSMENLNQLYLWFLPVIGERHMMLQLVLLPYQGHLIFYGGVEVETISLFGLQNTTREALVNRIEAMHRWFVSLANVK